MKARDLMWILLMGVVVTVSFVAASRRAGTGEPAVSPESRPVTVEPVPGTELYRVTLSPEAVKRLGIETATAGQGDAGTSATRLAGTVSRAATQMTVPYSAVLYDVRGETWVYTSPEPDAFVRYRIRVDRIDGDRVTLVEGPPAGTTIVTVGGAALLAAELDH